MKYTLDAWRLRIKPANPVHQIELSTDTEEEAVEWKNAIKRVTEHEYTDRGSLHREIEMQSKIAKELSDKIVYCSAVSFDQDRIKRGGRNPQEMSSFSEKIAEKIMFKEQQFFLWYHQVMLSRVYPGGQRIDSSNYNPVPFWNVGYQMVALNYQTPDKYIQINEGKFLQNGRCGYVLKPSFMRKTDYNPNREINNSQINEESLIFTIKIIAARHLTKSKRGIVSPSVEIEVIGTKQDCNKHTTKTITDNGFNPMWDESFKLEVSCPSLVLLRFAVYDIEMFTDTTLIAQATYPILCLRRGFRSVPLRNVFSKPLEMASLLVHLNINEKKGASEETPRVDHGTASSRSCSRRKSRPQLVQSDLE